MTRSAKALWIVLAVVLMAAAPASTRPTAKDRELLDAVSLNQSTRAETLIRAGANVNAVHPPLRLTPLLRAAEIDLDMVKLLLRHGAAVNVHDRDGLTPLIKAVGAREHATVVLLLDAGANVDARDGRGHTALTHAIMRVQPQILETLIERGASVNVVSAMGTTAWSIAQNMRAAAQAMPDRQHAHHDHPASSGTPAHPMRSKREALRDTQAVLDVLVAAGIARREQEPRQFNAMERHGHEH